MDDLLVRVPKSLRNQFAEIAALIDRYCAAYLNDEYRDLCRACAAEACRSGVSFGSGKAAGWAAGVLSAVAHANFLGQRSESALSYVAGRHGEAGRRVTRDDA